MKKYVFIAIIIPVMLLSGCGETLYKAEESAQSVTGGTSYDNTKIAWGFKNNPGFAPDVPSEWSELLRRYDGYYLGDTGKKYIYLTFDEGYENGYTPKILDTLKKTNTPAAFFITGPYLKTESEIVKRMVEEGHIVGNHTVNHPSMPDVTENSQLERELKELDDNFYNLTGKHMKYIRPPKGEFSERTLALSKKAGYKTVLWSSAYADWDVNNQKGTDYAVKIVTERLHNGNIILLHAVSKDNADGLEEIINKARAMGYEFKSLDEL